MDDPAQTSPAPRRRLSLTRADLQTSVGLELLEVLQTIAGDGRLTPEEVEQLRAWLAANDAAALPGHAHLETVINDVLADGVITDDEFEVLHDAVLRVLPAELRSLATLRRRQRRSQERLERQEAKALERDQQRADRERNRPLLRGDFMVAGTRYDDRQDACELCSEDDRVWLERERDNEHDRNAVLVETDAGDTLGYVPREDAREFAPLLDGGARQDFTIKKTLETARGQVIPVVRGALYAGQASVGHASRAEMQRSADTRRPSRTPPISASTARTVAGATPNPEASADATGAAVPKGASPQFGKGIWWLVLALALVGGLLAALRDGAIAW